MATKPFESRIQDLVYNVDVGIGLRLIKFGLYVLFLLAVMVFYTASEFRGLKEAEAMDYAQLGRNLMLHHRLYTQNIRPASMWYLIENVESENPRYNHNPRIGEHPDILHPPLYPTALAVGFKLMRSAFRPIEPGKVWLPEQWIIMPMGHICTVLTGLMLYFMARRLFDGRVALLSVTLFFLSDSVWRTSISGLPVSMATLFTTAAMYTALVSMARREEGRAVITWFLPLGLSAMLCGAAFLTRYGTAIIVPALALYVGLSSRGRGWRWSLFYVAIFLAVISPWLVRNIMVSGGPLGLAPYIAMNGDDPVADNLFERSIAPAMEFGTVTHTLTLKFLRNLARMYNDNLRTIGDGVFIGLFITTYFYSFAREQTRRFRWCAGMALGLGILLAAVFGAPTARLLHLFIPVVLVYAIAFFYILLDRLQLRLPIMRMGAITSVVLLGAFPLLLTLLPPRAALPYPPYYPPYIAHVSGMLTEDELLCTDMPWATAWYGDRSSLLLPLNLDDFYEINDYTKRVSGLYFTTITRDREFVRTLQTGPLRTWFPVMQGQIPPDFPLQQGFPLNNLDQIFLTDRQRW